MQLHTMVLHLVSCWLEPFVGNPFCEHWALNERTNVTGTSPWENHTPKVSCWSWRTDSPVGWLRRHPDSSTLQHFTQLLVGGTWHFTQPLVGGSFGQNSQKVALSGRPAETMSRQLHTTALHSTFHWLETLVKTFPNVSQWKHHYDDLKHH